MTINGLIEHTLEWNKEMVPLLQSIVRIEFHFIYSFIRTSIEMIEKRMERENVRNINNLKMK